MKLRLLLLLSVLSGPGVGCASTRHSDAEPRQEIVVRIEGPLAALSTPPGAVEWIKLESESAPGRGILFARYRSTTAPETAGGELFRVVARVGAKRPAPTPGVAVYAEWQLGDLSHRAAFEQNRAALFDRRTEVIPGFYADWLLERLDRPGHYLVVGLYAEASAREQARTHPEIRAFAAAHPIAAFGARDVFGVRNARVLELCTAATC